MGLYTLQNKARSRNSASNLKGFLKRYTGTINLPTALESARETSVHAVSEKEGEVHKAEKAGTISLAC